MLQAWKVCARSVAVLLFVALFLSSTPVASGVVLHPGYDSPGGLSRPNSNVVGGMTVAIAPNFALTARHVGTNVGGRVRFGGTSYVVKQVYTFGSADLKLLRLGNTSGGNANLRYYTPLYTRTDEVGKTIVMAGNGKGRGSKLYRSGSGYAYSWGSGALRFGANKVNYSTSLSAGGYSSRVLVTDFDPVGSSTAVRYEAANASGDSGSGWFVNDGGTWKLVGIANAVEHSGSSWFNDPDRNYAVRISYYASAIRSKMGSNAYSTSYSYTTSKTSSYTIPEPTTAAVAAGLFGGLVLVRRRRGG